jgi:hypothetical protein
MHYSAFFFVSHKDRKTMKHSWIFPQLMEMQSSLERMIRQAVEDAKENERWDLVADDLIDAKQKVEAALRVKEG